MSRDTTCPPCQMGDHKHHYRIVEHAPEGGVGGAVCTCKGECKDGRYTHPVDTVFLEAIKAHDVPTTPTVVPLKRESA